MKKSQGKLRLAAWHMDRAAKAARLNDPKVAKDHMDRAKMYKAKGDEYKEIASRFTK